MYPHDDTLHDEDDDLGKGKLDMSDEDPEMLALDDDEEEHEVPPGMHIEGEEDTVL